MIVVGFAALAFLGALVRALVTDLDAPFTRQMWGTLTVNIAGAFLLGLLQGRGSDVRVIVGIGGLGSLTTFSTFVAQAECIAREGATKDAALYIVATVVLGIFACWIGWQLA